MGGTLADVSICSVSETLVWMLAADKMCNLHNPSLNEDLYQPYFFMMQSKNCYKILITTSISLNRKRINSCCV